MPEGTDKPADGQQGDGQAAGAAGAAKPGKTFTQEELDAIIEARLKRAVPSDYEELKALKKANEAKAEAEKTDLQKAKDEAELAKANATRATASANAKLRRAAIIEAATGENAVDAETVVALLSGDDSITVDDDGTVKGAKTAVKVLLKEKTFLAKGAPAAGPAGEFGGNDPKALPGKIAELEERARKETDSAKRRALLQEARYLKIDMMQAPRA